MLNRDTLKILAAALTIAFLALPANARPPESFSSIDAPRRIIINTQERKLYYYGADNQLQTYKIAVGRMGMNWSGVTSITKKVRNPRWAPPPIVRKDKPELPSIVEPGPNNPLGAAVLVLGDGTYGIHGTNKASSIGTAASYGCFRMFNEDILVLFEKVGIGTEVIVLN